MVKVKNVDAKNVENVEKWYEMVKFEIEIGAMANKKLMENGYDAIRKFVIDLKFSSDEIKNFSDNYVVVIVNDLAYGELKILPLKLRNRGSKEMRIEYVRKDLERLSKLIEILYKNSSGIFLFKEGKLLYKESFENVYNELYDARGEYYTVSFWNFVIDVEKIINEKIVEKERMLSEDEIKKIVYEYLCSYNLRKDIEKLIDEFSVLVLV